MTTPWTYEFGYSWSVGWGHVIPLALFGGLAVAGLMLGWRRWIVAAAGLLAVWSLGGLAVSQFLFRINLPTTIPTPQFVASGRAEVVDVGAGSGRSTVGLLLARPDVRVTAIDVYDGYWGIDDNTPERLMVNARIAGVADRARAQVGDARAIPLASATYDGVISSYAIDHLGRDEIPQALSEVHRILKPGGEFLLMIVNVDLWARLTSPHAMAHHRAVDPARWRTMIEKAGFTVSEQGTTPSSLHFLARKRGEIVRR